MSARPVAVLAGGVGAARFLRGLVRILPPEEITVIGNTGDDMWWHGLYIAPDLDTVIYWLAGVADESRGWGVRGDTFTAQAALAMLTDRSWFQLGDRDLATHLYRTGRLAAGDLHFQEYFVREHWRPAVHEIYWTGLDEASPGPGVAEAIEAARLVLIAPSNPSISIEPILRVPGMRAMLRAARGKTVAISPLIGGRAVKGPTVELLRAEGVRPDALGVAERYQDLATGFVLDTADAALAPSIAAIGYRIAVRPTMLDDVDSARDVASTAVNLLREPAAA